MGRGGDLPSVCYRTLQSESEISTFGRNSKQAAAYFNLCATLYNMGKTGAEGVTACDKGIAADPKKADAYFVKGSMLFSDSKIDRNNKIVVPGACSHRRARIRRQPNARRSQVA